MIKYNFENSPYIKYILTLCYVKVKREKKLLERARSDLLLNEKSRALVGRLRYFNIANSTIGYIKEDYLDKSEHFSHIIERLLLFKKKIEESKQIE